MEQRPSRGGESSPATSDVRAGAFTVVRTGWSRWLPVLLGTGVGLVLCVGALLVARLLSPASMPAPKALETSLCADLAEQRYDALYRLLSPTLVSQGSVQQFTATQRELDALHGKVTDCGVASEQIAGSSAQIDLRLTREQVGTATAKVTLVAVDGAWRILAYDTERV